MIIDYFTGAGSLTNGFNVTGDVYRNEDLLDVIVKMLNDKYFSYLLETKYSKKKDLISKYAKKIASKPLERSDTRNLLLKTYRCLRNLWLKEEKRADLDLRRDFERCDKLPSVMSYESIIEGFNSTNIDYELVQLEIELMMSDSLPRYSDYVDISLIIEEGEPIAQFLAAEKALEEVPESYPILELYKPKKHFKLELLRGRAPGILSLVS